MPRTAINVGRHDHGRPMSLEEFEHAQAEPGYLYELGRGVIKVVDVPHPRHFGQVEAIRDQLFAYKLAHPGRIYGIGSAADCKLLVPDLQSERHPDITVYKTPSPEGKDVWAKWIPEIAVEVVSPGSEDRDYEQKREEYLLFGVKEYWIFDAEKEEMLVLRRSGASWAERKIHPGKPYATRLLPGLEFDCSRVFQAARDVRP